MYYKKKLQTKLLIKKNYRICNFASEVGKISFAKKTYAILDGWMEGWIDESMDG